MESVRVRAPCSTSNLGPGYDVIGLALDALHDVVEVELRDERRITINIESEGASSISTKPEENTAGLTALALVKDFGEVGLSIRIIKGIPPGSGLGSSGASAAATAVALNHLLSLNLPRVRLAAIAAEGERAAAGAAHADNVAPAIFGGLTIIKSYNPLDVLDLPSPNVEFVLAVPRGIPKTTKQARAVIPKNVAIEDMITHIAGTATLVAGLLKSDPVLVGRAMMTDAVIEPARSTLYPGYLKAKKAALSHGALGVTLSGAGPTVIAVIDPTKDPSDLAKAMREAFESEGIRCDSYRTRPTGGASVLGQGKS